MVSLYEFFVFYKALYFYDALLERFLLGWFLIKPLPTITGANHITYQYRRDGLANNDAKYDYRSIHYKYPPFLNTPMLRSNSRLPQVFGLPLFKYLTLKLIFVFLCNSP